MNRPKVTFFMIAYNEEASVRRAVESVLRQTEQNVELYVRNNGSKDRTGEIVRKLAQRDSRVHLVENKVNWRKDEAGKIPFTNKRGAVDIWPIDRDTLGDYVAFLDADDQLDPAFVKEMLREAEKLHAEITVCGNVFTKNGKVAAGQRLPPNLQLREKAEWGPALQDFNTFVLLYNVFRTYWGKLFQRDFFLRHYDEAWPPVGGAYGGFLDTAAMLRYLRRCERLACVTKPLYWFTIGSGSTYANFSSAASVGKALQAESLFDEGQAFLRSAGALTQENGQFLYQLNWAFCWEAMEGLQRLSKIEPHDIDRIIVMLNNRIAAAYLPQSSLTICQQLEPLLQSVWHKSGQNMVLYLRYPFRLMYARKLAEANPSSDLLPVLVMGVLCDLENQNGLGWDLLPLLEESFPGIKQSVQVQIRMNWTKRHNSLRNWWVESVQQLDNADGAADTLAQLMTEAFEQERYEEASGLLSELSRSSPLHRDGIYCRIQMAELIGEHELATVLAVSAHVLFGLDADIQQMCWFILSKGEELK